MQRHVDNTKGQIITALVGNEHKALFLKTVNEPCLKEMQSKKNVQGPKGMIQTTEPKLQVLTIHMGCYQQ